jgi:integrase
MVTNKEILNDYKVFREVNNKAYHTIKEDITAMEQLLKFTNNKPFKDVDEKDTIGFMKTLKSLGTKTIYGQKLILFFRWLHKLEKRERPENMKWFEFPSKDLMIKKSDPDKKKHLITDEEYKKIIQFTSNNPKWSALYETLYISGARPDEVAQMNYEDVEIDEKGQVTITIYESKKIPRRIPLMGNPEQLMRWYNFHPTKDKKAPLFPSESNRRYMLHLVEGAIRRNFNRIKKQVDIKKTLTPKDFRKTRGTILFSSRDPIFDDTEIGQYMGWKPSTVIQRRQEYDLRGFDDLKEKIKGIIPKAENYDTIKAERDRLEAKHEKEITDQKKQIEALKEVLQVVAGNVSGLANASLRRSIKSMLEDI